MADETKSTPTSPFHEGERHVQARLHVREETEAVGRKLIQDRMTDEHRAFVAQLPFIVLGAMDAAGRAWASLLAGRPGFVRAEGRTRLTIAHAERPGDPALNGLSPGAPIGILGIELETRRRNRFNGRVATPGPTLRVGLTEAYGNCPKYIQSRAHRFVRDPEEPTHAGIATLAKLDGEARSAIEAADTFFIATLGPAGRDGAPGSADVSHRGGRPGFVRVDDERTLTVPDYAGNNFFNTLGNLVLDPRAGILFVDFTTGDLLFLSGTIEIIWDGPEVRAFPGAERAWRFQVERVVRIRDAVALRWTDATPSPVTLATGTWADAEKTLANERDRVTWRKYRIARLDDESETVRSIYLEPADDRDLPAFRAGQHLPVRIPSDGSEKVQRIYTLSMAPADAALRISVKREPGGRASNAVHDRLQPGDVIDAGPPAGAFTLDPDSDRPVVLLSAGIGVTPMIAMLRQIVSDGIRHGRTRPVSFVHGDRNGKVRAFHDEVRRLEEISDAVSAHFVLSHPGPGDNYDEEGHVNVATLERVLPADAAEVYVCGPPGFMQAVYDGLRTLGVPDARIFTETFGPASLVRDADANLDQPAKEAQVTFTRSGRTVTWTPDDGTLLDLAEADGRAPPFDCRLGHCASCATRLESGDVHYTQPPRTIVPSGCVLTCSTVPKASSGEAVASVRLDL